MGLVLWSMKTLLSLSIFPSQLVGRSYGNMRFIVEVFPFFLSLCAMPILSHV